MNPNPPDSTRTLVLSALTLASGLALYGCSNSDSGTAPPPGAESFSHAAHFTDNPYVGPNMNVACVGCHAKEVQDLLQTGHWNWSGVATHVTGVTTETHGKVDFINNFCIAIPTNEGRCTQCHVGTGWADSSFDFSDPAHVDCLVCHDTTGTYVKAPTTAGMPVPGLDWQAIASGIGMPRRDNCGKCHYSAGGDDNVKHGDLAVNLNDTTREYDVHMGTDGGDMSCTACHVADDTHGIGGMPYHSVGEGHMKTCTTCHGASPHDEGTLAATIVASHPTLACQVCHIPAIARFRTTKVEWYWEQAGDLGRTPVDVGDGRVDYDAKKGEFVWANDVRPVLRRHDGTWNKMIYGVNDTYSGTPSAADPVVLGEPAAPKDPGAAGATMIYPFKKMVGNQVADTVNQRVMVPHLFGTKGGPNAYWGHYDWDLALQDAAAKLGIPYSGTFGFVDTVMYLGVNHEIAPKEAALGSGGCFDCHGSSGGESILDWSELGRTDPLGG
ncbi:MAG: tetrathionate reductase family octaheme c-type cytochrome [Planctomycetes bacterium]|nr:tetrathionate reductase family octaheme c-type cytochrome [Planctomycetota bacterium]